MIALYVFCLTLIIVLLGSVTPVVQIMISKRKQKESIKYFFSEELVNYDMEFESCRQFVPRTLLATRGWVRGPQGKIMTGADLEHKKAIEYSIELP